MERQKEKELTKEKAKRKETYKIEYLQEIERKVQAKWEVAKKFHVDATDQDKKSPNKKYFATFPYPYMNGRLHLGHAFSLLKGYIPSDLFIKNQDV